MTQEKINKYFESDLGQQCLSLFVAPDDRVFIRYEEAADHSRQNNFDVRDIQEMFYNPYFGVDPKFLEVINFIEEKAEFKGWENAACMADYKYGHETTDEAMAIMDLHFGLDTSQQFHCIDSAITQLLVDHPEFQEEHTTGWDMIKGLKIMRGKLKYELVVDPADMKDLPF